MVMRGATWLLMLALSVLAGCSMQQAYQQLPPEERARFRAYSRIMNSSQRRAYLELSSAAERAAFAEQVGATQVLDGLSETDRNAVLQGQPFRGMSAQALRLMWGMPCWQRGARNHAKWFYYGDTIALTRLVRHCTPDDTVTEVALRNDRVEWWTSSPAIRGRAPFGRR